MIPKHIVSKIYSVCVNIHESAFDPSDDDDDDDDDGDDGR